MLLLVSTLVGGVGLFLLGMILMSDGLKAAAGSALRGILVRSTGTTMRAFASGAGITALVQSSSATILATIGFVSAGLLTFTSALGVIVGAAVGTTSTGWIVSLLGLKLNVAALAMPLIGVGALLRLFATGRVAHVGMALAGFGLIFVGIELLRAAMGDVALQFDLGYLDGETILGGLQLVLIGLVMTVALQSSSAAVALALTAVHTGAIGLEQAAFLVIGQNVGTTVTSALASIGGSVPARRTAAGHMLFNSFSGVIAFVAAGPLLIFSGLVTNAAGAEDPAVVIAVFHTVFNVAGAAVILPLLHPFAGIVTRIIPEREPSLTRHLDRTLLEVPAVAIEASYRTVVEVARIAVAEVLLALDGEAPSQRRLEEADQAIHETHRFLGSVRMSRDSRDDLQRRLAVLHASDHLGRLIRGLLRKPLNRQGTTAELREAMADLQTAFQSAERWLRATTDGEAAVAPLARAAERQARFRREYRAELLRQTAAGEIPPETALARLEVMRQVDRLLYHLWRAVHHLALPPDPLLGCQAAKRAAYLSPSLSRFTTMAARHRDRSEQALRDLEQAADSRDRNRHEWACFAAQQAAEKAVRALHLYLGQDAWGHVVARLIQDLPGDVEVSDDLIERARVLDNFYIPTRYPNSHSEGAPHEHFGPLQSRTALDYARSIVEFARAEMA